MADAVEVQLMVPAVVQIERYDVSVSSMLSDRLGRTLKDGGVIALPTESFYGLAVDPCNEGALARLWQIKGRSEGKPILVLIGERSQLDRFVHAIPPAAHVLMDTFWPGPLTIVFPAAIGLSDAVTAGTGSVGVRLSAWPPLADLLRRVGPVTGTSANREGLPPPCTAQEVLQRLGSELDEIVDGGATPGGLPSTVIDVRGPITILREGAIGRDVIKACLTAHAFDLGRDSR
ncbi:MAG: L-threonylcarbamoyladenylate synthase [Nitrospira sp.]|nr:L-threonylcarbamoyladenylate synthase [Nitrospira sp.]